MPQTRRNFLKSALAGTAAASLGRVSAAPEGQDPAAQVDKRPLGRIDTNVSILGLGLGSAFTGPNRNDPETVEKLLTTALDHGVNYWDTCRGYGPSESMIGPSVATHRNRIFLVTKSGGRTYDAFMRDVDKSLKELRTDRIDLLHIWNLRRRENLDTIETGALKAVRELIDQKVVGHFGITGHSGAAILIDAIQRFDPDAVLTVFPATRSDNGRYEDDLLPLARKRKMGVIAMKTVRHARNADLKGTDLIRYALSLDGIHSAIVGLDTLAHLQENLAMATDFAALGADERAHLNREVSRALADVPEPWTRPGYRDGRPA